MKKTMCALFVTLFALTFVACGDNVSATTTPEVSEEVDTTEYEDFEGEGAGQGVEKSDEELEALEIEASEYSSGEEYDTYVIESKEETKEEPKYEKPWYGPLGTSKFKAENYPYVSASEYWISENRFDLEGWIKANGGFVYYYSSDHGSQEEENEDTTMYKCYFSYSTGAWNIFIGSAYGFDLSMEETTGKGFMYVSEGNSELVNINQYECCTYADVINALDCTVKQIKENPEGPINEPSSH